MKKQKVVDKIKDDPLFALRHSTQHVMAMAIEELFEGAQKVMGPPIENGFYGDFDGLHISVEDFPKIEKRMQEIIETDLPITMRKVGRKELIETFKDNEFKMEMIDNILIESGMDIELTVCEIGSKKDKFYDIDLCMGNHIKSTGEIKAFKLLNVAGAYWHGDEKNKMLKRIYGTAFNSKKDLDEYLEMIEKAKERDHRRIGKEMELFLMDDEVGQGLPVWLPNGAFVRHKIMEFAFNTYLDRDYVPAATPHIASEALWSHSGHLDFYKDSMYGGFGIDEEQYRLKPMNCPIHTVIYNHRPRSYKELPFRIAEMGTVYRYEKSGVLHGLTRVRGFTQDDGHIVCTEEQLHDELIEALNLTLYILRTLGFEEFEVNLSVRDPENKDKFIGDDTGWEKAEKELESALNEVGYKNFVVDVGGAVFYGPKIDLKVADSLGRMWQLSTIQVDFNLPGRFEMTYINKNGEKKTPFMIHRALLGSLERFMGVYIEHTGGAFPVWTCPLHAVLIPISDKNTGYAQKIAKKLKEASLRAEIDDRSDSMQAKIRDAQLKKIPYMIILGDREEKNGEVSVRLRTEEDKGAINLDKFIEKVKNIELTKSLELW